MVRHHLVQVSPNPSPRLPSPSARSSSLFSLPDSHPPPFCFFSQFDAPSASSALQSSVHLRPSSPAPLLALARLHLQQKEYSEAVKLAQAARAADASVEEGWEALLLQAVAVASSAEAGEEGSSQDAMRDAQRAVVLRPWEGRGWKGLEFVQSRGKGEEK